MPPGATRRLAVATILFICMVSVKMPAQRPDHSGLFGLQRDFVHLVDKLTPAVVRVAGKYTGVIVDGRGYILSDAAAVPDQFKKGQRIRINLANGRSLDAEPIWRAKKSRTALLKILKGTRFTNIPAGNSDELHVGDLTLTIGNAFNQASQGGQPAVTVGHIAGLWSSDSATNIEVTKILTTAAINPGTSGGPLIDIRGSLIGINVQRRGDGDMGMVMPINYIRETYVRCEEAYKVLSLGASKRGSPRRYANFMSRAVIRVAHDAGPAVVSLRIDRTPPPPETAKKTGEKANEKPTGETEPEEKKTAGTKDKSKKKDSTELKPPKKERRDGVKRVKLKPVKSSPSPKKRNPPRRKRPTFKMKKREMPVSAVVIDPDGWILTATSNLWKTKKQPLGKIEVVLHDGRVLEAKRRGVDHIRGLTLLKVEARGLPVLPEIREGESTVGSFVAALGNPYGSDRFHDEPFMTWGVLSVRNQIDPAMCAFQTDALVNQANQGGALVDMKGRLMGILILYNPKRYGLNSGVGFAIPIWMVRKRLEELKAKKDIYPGYLGVRLTPVFEPDVEGIRVMEVVKYSPADRGGLKAGDCILQVNGATMRETLDVLLALKGVSDGERIDLEFLRGGVRKKLSFVAARRG